MIIFLVGYMASGKSSLGKKLARRLRYKFVDTDSVIETRENAEIADIMKYEGEDYFRALEAEVLRDVSSADNTVVSTGGGMPMFRDNMEFMQEEGVTVYLKRSAEQIVSRLTPYGKHKRPKLRNLNDEELKEYIAKSLGERDVVYSQSKITVDCEHLSDDEIVENIIKQTNDN